MHPSSTSNRVSPGGYTQKAPTGNHHHSPASMDSTPPADFQHSFWAKARGKVRQNRTTRQMRTGQSHTRTKDPRADKHGDKPRTYQPPSRDRCEHCGETGHNTGRCRHGGPITCHSCGELAHKSKHCHCAQTDDFYRGYWRDAYEEVASKDSSMMNLFPCHYSTSKVMKQVSVCSSISSKNDVGDCDTNSIMSTINEICNGVTQNTIMQNISRNSTCHGIYESVYKCICTNELWKICQVYNSPADGPCLLHSIVSSLKHQFVPSVCTQKSKPNQFT